MDGLEMHSSHGESHRVELTVIVNGRPKRVPGHEVSFEEVVNLAYDGHPPAGPNWVFTVTYRHAEGKKHDGSLTKGESVKIKEGTIFNVTATDKS
jgi:Multiubiquitin